MSWLILIRGVVFVTFESRPDPKVWTPVRIRRVAQDPKRSFQVQQLIHGAVVTPDGLSEWYDIVRLPKILSPIGTENSCKCNR